MIAGGAYIVGAIAEPESRLGGDENAIAPAFERFAQHRFGTAVGVHVGRVKQIDAGIEADIDDSSRLGEVIGSAPSVKKLVSAAKRAGAKAQDRNLEARASQEPIFHVPWMHRVTAGCGKFGTAGSRGDGPR